MYFTTATLAVAVLSLVSPIFALGINCRGGAACRFTPSDRAETLTDYINGIDQERHYKSGEHIACTAFHLILSHKSHLCAFIQKMDGASGSDILQMAHHITKHGCKACGSVPFNFPATNDVVGGKLPYNIVSSRSGNDGLC